MKHERGELVPIADALADLTGQEHGALAQATVRW